jgi:hypothetical protein
MKVDVLNNEVCVQPRLSHTEQQRASRPLMIDSPELLGLAELLGDYAPINLLAMDKVALLNRVDTKFVLTIGQLLSALEALQEHYYVLDIHNRRLHAYQTLYYDTANFALYLAHHNGHRVRYKVRSRMYLDSQRTFVEVKQKYGANRTKKLRLETDEFVQQLAGAPSEFVGAHISLDPQELEPKLLNTFSRVTLVSKHVQERLTIDVGLGFSGNDRVQSLSGLAIIEVKQSGFQRGSDIIRQMRAMHVQPASFSKYCIGVTSLYPHIKHNRFKPTMRLVDRIIGG